MNIILVTVLLAIIVLYYILGLMYNFLKNRMSAVGYSRLVYVASAPKEIIEELYIFRFIITSLIAVILLVCSLFIKNLELSACLLVLGGMKTTIIFITIIISTSKFIISVIDSAKDHAYIERKTDDAVIISLNLALKIYCLSPSRISWTINPETFKSNDITFVFKGFEYFKFLYWLLFKHAKELQKRNKTKSVSNKLDDMDKIRALLIKYQEETREEIQKKLRELAKIEKEK